MELQSVQVAFFRLALPSSLVDFKPYHPSNRYLLHHFCATSCCLFRIESPRIAKWLGDKSTYTHLHALRLLHGPGAQAAARRSRAELLKFFYSTFDVIREAVAQTLGLDPRPTYAKKGRHALWMDG